MQTVLCKLPLTTYNMYRERNCCTMHIAKATDMCSRATIASSTWNEYQLIDIFFSACCVNMLPPWPSSLRHSHPCLSPTCTRSVFEGGFEFLRPSVRGTPTTHREGLLLRVGALPCAPTYNRGVVQRVVFNRLKIAQPHECSLQPACKQYCCASGLQQHLIICTEDVSAARRTLRRLHTDIFSGYDCVFLVE